MATFVEFLSTLLDAKEQTIVWHNQTMSYSEHKALDKFQDELSENYDDLVESTTGIFGRPKNYSVGTLQNYTSHDQIVAYYKGLYEYIQKERKTIYQETWVQNQVDEIAALVARLLYLLTLK
jgi:hypothetical protein